MMPAAGEWRKDASRGHCLQRPWRKKLIPQDAATVSARLTPPLPVRCPSGADPRESSVCAFPPAGGSASCGRLPRRLAVRSQLLFLYESRLDPNEVQCKSQREEGMRWQELLSNL